MRNGVVLLLAAMCLTPGIDGLSKELGASYSAFTISFLRYLSAGLLALGVARLIGQPIRIPREACVGQVARTALLVGATTSLIGALALVPMAMAAGGFLVSPIVATLAGVLVFGERITSAQVLGAAVSLIGAIILTRPEAGIEPGALLALLGGSLLGLYLAATRAARASGGPLATLAIQCLLGAVLLAPIALSQGLPMVTGHLIAASIGLGVLAALAHFLTVAAYERAPSAVLAPFLYFNLVAALVVGYLWFGEVPNFLACLGLVFIVVGGLVSLIRRRENQSGFLRVNLPLRIACSGIAARTKMVTQARFGGMLAVLIVKHGGDHDGYVSSERTQA